MYTIEYLPIARRDMVDIAKYIGVKLANPDAKYAETSEGKTFEAKEQKARYIRIYTRGSILTSGTAHGGNHICEVEVYGKAIKNTTTQKKITVAFDTKGGNSIESLKVAAGESWSLPQNPTRAGYVFKGWYSDVNCTVAYTAASPVSADLTLFAKWEEDPTTSTEQQDCRSKRQNKRRLQRCKLECIPECTGSSKRSSRF